MRVKDIEKANKKRKEMEALLNQFYQTVDRKDLELAIGLSTPKPQQIDSVPQIEAPSTVAPVIPAYPASILVSEAGVIPLRYGCSNPSAQAHLLSKRPDVANEIIRVLNKHPAWREEIRKRKLSPEGMQEKEKIVAKLDEIENEAQTLSADFESSTTFIYYKFSQEGKSYELQNKRNEGQDNVLRFYAKPYGNTVHHDFLLILNK